jgi:hypothetical protein
LTVVREHNRYFGLDGLTVIQKHSRYFGPDSKTVVREHNRYLGLMTKDVRKAPDQVYWIGAPPSDARSAHT